MNKHNAVAMKCYLLSFFLSFFFSVSNAQQMIDSYKKEIVFTSVNVIPMDSERVLTDQVVVVKNGKIVSVGKTGKVKYSKTAHIIDGKGKYLIPGLTEMHAHVPPVDDLEPMKEVLMLFACNGVTTIRGMLGHAKHLELRKIINNGEITGPRFYTSGPSFNGNTVTSAAQGADMVRAQKKAGYDFLKLHPGLTVEKFNSISSTAKAENIPFAGHVSFEVGVWRAIDAGYATIDHMDGFIEGLVPGIENMTEQDAGFFGMYLVNKIDTSRIQKLMSGLRSAGIGVVPTQALAERWMFPAEVETFANAAEMIYMNNQTLTNWRSQKQSMLNNPKYQATDMNAYIKLRRRLIYECEKNGVRLLLGSDAPQVFNVPGFSLHHELGYMVDAGLTPYEALKTGTVNVAAFFRRSGEIGQIKPGMVSDLVLLNGNPLQDIHQTKNIAGVMLRNNWLPKTFIDQQLKALEKR
jgi:imidazolonepropionase-like amidohydrolase